MLCFLLQNHLPCTSTSVIQSIEWIDRTKNAFLYTVRIKAEEANNLMAWLASYSQKLFTGWRIRRNYKSEKDRGSNEFRGGNTRYKWLPYLTCFS